MGFEFGVRFVMTIAPQRDHFNPIVLNLDLDCGMIRTSNVVMCCGELGLVAMGMALGM